MSVKVNVGIYLIEMYLLRDNIFKISNDNKQDEYYLTDLFEIFKVNVIEMDKERYYEVLGANTKDELVKLEKYAEDMSYDL